MDNKDYVSYDVAKALKEKGYNIPCDSFFEENPDGLICWVCVHEPKKEVTENEYLQPALYDANKWLRNKFNICVEVSGLGINKYRCFVRKLRTEDSECLYYPRLSAHAEMSYEEALNEGIKRALKYI